MYLSRKIALIGVVSIVILLFVFVLIFQNLSNKGPAPTVSSKLGVVRGLHADDGDYHMYLGVPYATVNESDPFGPSTPCESYKSIYQAADDSVKCPQVDEFTKQVTGELDCLRLNIYVPNTVKSKNVTLPVLAFIHGGGFNYGGTSRNSIYDPKYLVRHDVIFVSINYRVGPYGFLEHPDVPGNQGLKDQVIALKWIKNNIDKFGGDANKITAFGYSAGAISVDLHLMFDTEVLFNQAILGSGTALTFLPRNEPDENNFTKLVTKLGFVGSNLNEALKFLSKIDPKLVIAACDDLGLNFKPHVEEQKDGSFITEKPRNVARRDVENFPILLGNCEHEMGFEYGMSVDKIPDPEHVINYMLSHTFDFRGNVSVGSKYFNRLAEIVRHFYVGDDRKGEIVRDGLIEFESDLQFLYPAQRTIRNLVDSGAKKLYTYIFSYDGDRNLKKKMNDLTTKAVVHFDDMGYLFDAAILNKKPKYDDQLTIDRMTTLWTNFVKYGNPTPVETKLLPFTWPAVTKDAMHYLNISSTLTFGKRPFHDRLAFWELFYLMNKNYIRF